MRTHVVCGRISRRARAQRYVRRRLRRQPRRTRRRAAPGRTPRAHPLPVVYIYQIAPDRDHFRRGVELYAHVRFARKLHEAYVAAIRALLDTHATADQRVLVAAPPAPPAPAAAAGATTATKRWWRVKPACARRVINDA